MATRSTIWVEINENEFEGVYCHFDGYLEGVGQTLVNNYNSKEKALEIIKLGSLSYLGNTLDKENTCAYCRDRNEDFSKYTSNLENILKYQEEYNYIFRNGNWYYFETNYNKNFSLNDLKLISENL